MKIGLSLLFFVFCYGFIVAQSNEGTDFWFGFMEHRDVGNNTKVAMISSKVSTTGTIEIPKRNWSQNFAVPANGVVVIELPGFTETIGSEFVEDNAIHLTSVLPVSLYIHQYFQMRSEASVVLPTESLGREYFTLMYDGITNNGREYPPEFLVVATENNTEIRMTVTADTEGGRSAGSTFIANLDRGEVYQVRADRWNGDLTGSYIESDKKVAVFAGTAWSEVPTGCAARDNLLEQMYPLQSLGTKFVTIPNANISEDRYRILATEDNTMIEVQSTGSNSYSLDRGEYVEFSLSQASFIESSKPILAAQYMIGSDCNGHNVGDPSMVILNSIQQFRDTVTLFNSMFQNITENYINIITRTIDADQIILDGTNLVSAGQNFTPVGSNGEFSFINLRVDAGAHTIISSGCGVIATAYGYGVFESYAYSGGANFRSINRNPIPEGGCLNDTVLFDAMLDSTRYTFEWDLGDEIRTEPRFMKFYEGLGDYPARVIITDICLNEVDTFYRDVRITLRQAVNAEDFVRVCEDEIVNLEATDLAEARYEWTGPRDYFSEEQFPVIVDAKPEMSGTYSVIGIISGCATFPAFTDVEITPLPEPILGSDSIICSRDGIDLILEPGNFVTYQWQDGTVNSNFFVPGEGIYHVAVSDEFGCVGVDTVLFLEQCPTNAYLPNVFTPNGDQANDAFGVLGNDIISMRLQIFDRWGVLVFESFDPNTQWDGTRQGQNCEMGVYVWSLQLEGYLEGGVVFQEVRSGNVTLLR